MAVGSCGSPATAPLTTIAAGVRPDVPIAYLISLDGNCLLWEFDYPPDITAYTGLDALTQLIEPYTSCRANPMTDAFCIEGIGRAARSLRRACEHGADGEATATYQITKNLSILAEVEYRENASTDTRIAYERMLYSIGVVWQQ